MNPTYDAIVVGGRVAGSPTASAALPLDTFTPPSTATEPRPQGSGRHPDGSAHIHRALDRHGRPAAPGTEPRPHGSGHAGGSTRFCACPSRPWCFRRNRHQPGHLSRNLRATRTIPPKRPAK